jgi:hypothetical protein
MSWVEEELGTVALGDARLDQRFRGLVAALADHPTASVPAAVGTWSAVKATYRLWDHPRVTADRLLAAHARSTRARMRTAGWVLLVQDTTELDYTSHPALQGRGSLSHPDCRGIFVHSTLAVSPEGLPLGVVTQQYWARDPAQRGIGRQRNRRPTAQKESQKWLTALERSHRHLAGTVTTVTVADREADCYDLFVADRRPTAHLLIRAKHDRALVHETAHLRAALAAQPVAATQTVMLPRQHDKATTRPARVATLALRWATVTLAVPRLKTGAPVTVQALLVTEVDPPAGGEPVDWVLLTTLPVPSAEVGWLLVDWYTYRWLIERFHFTLKSGCRVEDLQLATTDRLTCAVATYAIVAWRLMSLRYLVEQVPEVSCEVVVTREEWQAAHMTVHPTVPVPATPPSLRTFLWDLGRLGGFLGRTSDGSPGVTALWRGWARLQDIRLGIQAYQQLQLRLMGNA